MRLLTEFEEKDCYTDEENESALEEMINTVKKKELKT